MFDDGAPVIFTGAREDIEPNWDDAVYEEIMDPDLPKLIGMVNNYEMTCTLELPCGTEVQCSLKYIEDYDG